jgi:hypothetical protein
VASCLDLAILLDPTVWTAEGGIDACVRCLAQQQRWSVMKDDGLVRPLWPGVYVAPMSLRCVLLMQIGIDSFAAVISDPGTGWR